MAHDDFSLTRNFTSSFVWKMLQSMYIFFKTMIFPNPEQGFNANTRRFLENNDNRNILSCSLKDAMAAFNQIQPNLNLRGQECLLTCKWLNPCRPDDVVKFWTGFFHAAAVFHLSKLAQYITTYTAMLDNTYTLIANYLIYWSIVLSIFFKGKLLPA